MKSHKFIPMKYYQFVLALTMGSGMVVNRLYAIRT